MFFSIYFLYLIKEVFVTKNNVDETETEYESEEYEESEPES